MSRNLTRVWPLLVLAFASEVWALGLGDIRLSSALNEPLRAEIELLSATPEELDNLTVALASQETFARYGLDRPLFLQSIAFKVFKSGAIDGNVISVVSQDPVTEPFVTFLVEATWSRGRLLREYTLLLDPPTFAPPPVQESAAAVAAPRQSTQADSGRIERQIERQPEPQTSPPPPRPAQPSQPSQPSQPAPAPTRSEPPPDPASFDTTSGGDHRVQRGETLWGIAARVRPDSRLTMNQTMLAIFEANPQAFAGNINIMSAGAELRIPSADEVFRINRGDALREAQRQNNEWGGVMPVADTTEPSLTLVPPDDDQTGYDEGAGTSLDDDAVVDEDPTETRIRDIEETLAAHQDSLIEIQDDELAALRQELARLRGEEYIEPDVIDVDADVALDDDTTIDTTLDPDLIDDDLLADDADLDDIVADDTDTAVDTDTAPPPVVVSQPRDEPGIVDRALEFVSGFWGILIGGLLVVLGVLVWFARRAARSDDEESTGVWDALDADDLDGESLASTERLRALAREDDTAIVVVEQESAPTREAEDAPGSETIEAPAPEPPPAPIVEEDAAETTGESVALDDTFSSETAINLDQSDPVAEADFHMAYGLYDQAADLINGALAAEPEREDLLAKLCEIYFVWGNHDAFVDASSRLRTVVGDGSNAEWDKIVIMGQQIAGDHEMFSGAGPAATREVDLSFEGALDEEGELDMDLAIAGTGESEIIDLGDEAAEGAGGDEGLDMLFDTAETEAPDLEDTEAATADVPAAEETGLTAEMPTTETDLGDTTGEVPAIDATGESPALDESGEMPAIDETGEVPAVEDTGLTAEMPAAGEESGLTAEMPTAESPMTATDATGEAPTIEEQFKVLEETGELPVISIGDDEATKLASLDDDDEGHSPDATGELEIDDLGLDLDDLAKTGLAFDLEDTAEREVLPLDDDLVETGTNEELEDDLAATGRNPAVDTDAGTGIHEALDVADALAATNETDIAATDDTSRKFTLDDIEDTGIGAAIDTSLLDATGQTQVLTDDMGVETASEIENVISDQDKTLLAPMDEDSSDGLPEDAETLLAPLDDEGGDESTVLAGSDDDFDFAKTEALPKDVFTGNNPMDDTGASPGIAETDVDLDLDDLTAALRVSEVGDTVDQPREDATVEHPRPSADDVDLDEDKDRDPTARLAPEDVSGDLHDARTMTEVGTKLDLARAYVDMGDPSGARSILDEVLDEGDDSQKQQAQQLLDSLPT